MMFSGKMKRNEKVKKPAAMAQRRGKFGWFNINWVKANAQVKQLQIRIAVAYKNGEMDKVTE
jgi:hypothetical protein